MLATFAALQLLVAQVSAPADSAPPDDARPRTAEAEPAPAAPAPEPPPGAAPPPSGDPSREPARAPPPSVVERPRQQSLLSAESLRGGSAALAWAGWPEIGAIYAIGFSSKDDAGPFIAHDWAKSENRIGVYYRRPFSKAGGVDVAARLSVAWYTNFGSTYLYEENHSDHGLEVVPGIGLSTHGAGGILSGLAEAPMTVTTKVENGFLFAPRVSFAFETPLYPNVSIGAKVGAGYRAGAGDAPLREGRGELQFLVLVGYQLL
jgi:hypothetical protein